MCILCVVQKWSRRVATMLPWLVIPLIGLWALSQLLPPGFQFEVTSPRLACVMVLLITLFWYEVLMPQLSAWRVRRNARLRERRRLEAMELQKLRKTATRRCRNCHMPYRDQNPGGGRFMCSYCGHISKRPVLDIRGSAVSGLANSGIGKILNGKVWSENGWICGQDWSENGNWGPSFEANSSHWGKNGTKSGTGFFSGDDRYSAERSYLGLVPYACKLLSSFFLSVRWLWRKIFRVTSSRDVDLLDPENKRLLSKKGENGANFPESRGERARRKAEEKRQARIEKELLEEEERKQREEVARLVEERRKLRDEKLEAEKERDKGSTPDRERDYRRDAERRRHERRKEKDRGSSKSNSDGEELEKKANRVSERKREFDKRSDIEKRDASRTAAESGRSPISEGHAMKSNINSFNRVSGSGSRYFDRMKGSFLSSTKAFNGAGFFGRGTQNSAPAGTKVNRPAGPVELQASVNRRGVHSAEHLSGKLTANGDNKITQIASHRPVGSDLQPFPIVQKKSWQQLFTHSSTLPSLDASNTIYQQSQNYQLESHNPQLPDQSSSGYHLDRQDHFGIPLLHPIASLYGGSMSNVAISPPGRESVMPHVGGSADDFMSDEAELYEDPCYVPDPVSLIGPVSESLDNFSLDLGAGFISNAGLESSHVLKNVSASVDVSKPAPIESPFSRSRVSEERHVSSSQPQYTPKLRDAHTSLLNESNSAVEQGTWQMWGTPLGHDGLGLGGPASWILPLGQNKTNLEEILHPSSNEAMPSQFAMEKSVINGTPSPQNIHVSGCQNGGSYSPLGTGSNDNDIWLHNTLFQPLSGDAENPFPPNPRKDLSQNEVTRDSPSKPAAIHLFQSSATNSWSKRDWAVPEGEGNDGHSTLAIPHIGGLFSTPDVQSLWSFK